MEKDGNVEAIIVLVVTMADTIVDVMVGVLLGGIIDVVVGWSGGGNEVEIYRENMSVQRMRRDSFKLLNNSSSSSSRSRQTQAQAYARQCVRVLYLRCVGFRSSDRVGGEGFDRRC